MFAIHKEVIAELVNKLMKYQLRFATGETPTKTRHKMVKEFQNNQNVRLFIANVDAMGVGHTLTKANRVVLVEYAWVPGVNRQAIDRSHRYGLNHSLLAQYLVLANSLDKPVLEALKRKENVIELI